MNGTSCFYAAWIFNNNVWKEQKKKMKEKKNEQIFTMFKMKRMCALCKHFRPHTQWIVGYMSVEISCNVIYAYYIHLHHVTYMTHQKHWLFNILEKRSIHEYWMMFFQLFHLRLFVVVVVHSLKSTLNAHSLEIANFTWITWKSKIKFWKMDENSCIDSEITTLQIHRNK